MNAVGGIDSFLRHSARSTRLDGSFAITKQVVRHTEAGIDLFPAHDVCAGERQTSRRRVLCRAGCISTVGFLLEFEPDAGAHRQAPDSPTILEEDTEVVVQIRTVGSSGGINGDLVDHEILRAVLDVVGKICSDAAAEPPLQVHSNLEVVAARHVAHRGAGAVLMHGCLIQARAEWPVGNRSDGNAVERAALFHDPDGRSQAIDLARARQDRVAAVAIIGTGFEEQTVRGRPGPGHLIQTARPIHTPDGFG